MQLFFSTSKCGLPPHAQTPSSRKTLTIISLSPGMERMTVYGSPKWRSLSIFIFICMCVIMLILNPQFHHFFFLLNQDFWISKALHGCEEHGSHAEAQVVGEILECPGDQASLCSTEGLLRLWWSPPKLRRVFKKKKKKDLLSLLTEIYSQEYFK